MYVLAIREKPSSDLWELRSFPNENELIGAIQRGETYGREFKIFAELELKIEDYIKEHKQQIIK